MYSYYDLSAGHLLLNLLNSFQIKVAERSVSISSMKLIIQEDEKLRKLVDVHGCKKWSLIASKMQTKASKQVSTYKTGLLNICRNLLSAMSTT